MCRCRIDLHSPENCSTGFYYSDETCRWDKCQCSVKVFYWLRFDISCEPFPLRRNDIWNQPSDDHFIPRSIPKIEEQVTSSQLQPDVPKQKDAASIQRPQFIPVIAKVDDEKEEEEKKAPVERFTFVNNWRNQYFGRFTTPKRSW